MNFLTQKEIEEKFEELIDSFDDYDGNENYHCNPNWEEVKSFLHSTRAADKEAVMEMIKEMKKTCGGDLQMNDEYEQCHGYNQALSDLLTQLKDKWIIN